MIMKTTNILLAIIAIFLFLNLIKGTSFNIISQGFAQNKQPLTKESKEVLNVRIVTVDDDAIMHIRPKKDFQDNPEVFPVYVMNGQPTSLGNQYGNPVKVFQTNK